MLAYGIPVDLIDDHLAMGESISILCVKHFAMAILNVLGSTYLRAPNVERAFGISQAQFSIVRGPARF
jgi:hypothetical protein